MVAVQFTAFLAASTPIRPTTPPLGLPEDLQQSWAQYAPWFPAATYVRPPTGCEVVQRGDRKRYVKQLQRHGARYPEKHPTKAIQKSIRKLKRAKRFKDASLAFVETYMYTLGVDDLVPFGAAQSFDAGQEHYARYAGLVNEDMLPFVRASESDRVIDSARNWSAGFAHASDQTYIPDISVIIPQLTNDTLDDKMCPQVGNSNHATKKWMNVFAPAIAKRINAVAPGAKLKNTDIVNLMSLCPFDTVAHEAPSPWCDLFTRDEWASFEYYGDLTDYYGNGYGQQLGRVQGVGYVNELLARLTGRPVQDATQTNRTLDASPITFPLNRRVYVDFSHDNQMISIYSALGLYVQPHDLDPRRPDMGRTWRDARLVPFSGRMITEKLTCDDEGTAGTHRRAAGEYVRVLVNDAVQPLASCGAQGEDGLCTLAAFVESQAYARHNGNGDWELCFAK